MINNICLSFFGKEITNLSSLDYSSWSMVFAKESFNLVPISSIYPKHLVTINYPKFNHFPVSRSTMVQFKKNFNILSTTIILTEPASVEPMLHKKQFINIFDYVFTPSPLWFDDEKTYFFKWPQDTEIKISKAWKLRTNLITSVAANKYSFHKKSNYAIRGEIFKASRYKKYNLTVRGEHWNMPKKLILKHYFYALIKHLQALGLNEFKFCIPFFNLSIDNLDNDATFTEHLNNFKFCLIIENESTYISEKLFNALVNGCVPLYLGPPINLFGLPKNLVISLPRNKRKIKIFLKNISSLDISVYKKAQEDFLSNTEQLNSWNYNTVFRKIQSDLILLYSKY